MRMPKVARPFGARGLWICPTLRAIPFRWYFGRWITAATSQKWLWMTCGLKKPRPVPGRAIWKWWAEGRTALPCNGKAGVRHLHWWNTGRRGLPKARALLSLPRTRFSKSSGFLPARPTNFGFATVAARPIFRIIATARWPPPTAPR